MDEHSRQHLLTYLFFCSPSHLICVHIPNNCWRCDCTWYALWQLYLFCFVFCFLFFVFCFLFFGFCFLFLITTKVFQLKFKSRNCLTCFRHHLNTTRFGTRMQWSKRSERHRAHMYSYPWYWLSMANLPGSLALHHPSSRTMLSRMLVSLTTLFLLHSVLIIYSCSPQQRRV